ncbi:hypothetical protein [Cellulomonas gilvus]|uniref:Uncharacterized protein n=1 Tax=Cellulomonas gilvus (strain ATCC 13127 / NRRL B-14078) TaxID=593907 RepID=F8A7V0_CELGA|nr:hypothetical protein [Cellulomonas gilvus]AEI13633.1 hypothetical protein Celgi_3142 [Cellulomonas gilvus ATCC 13127]
MSEPNQPEPLLGITAQDAGMDRMLRRSLTELRDQNAGTPLGDLLDDVLAGRRSLRDVARTPEFDAAVAPAAQKATQQWAALSPEERDTLVAQGKAQLEESRAAAFQEREARTAD